MDIAYQVLGDGPVDLVVLPGPFVSFDSIDAEPALYRFHRRLASFARVIRFDQRGMGASSRSRVGRAHRARILGRGRPRGDGRRRVEQATIFGSGWTGMTGLVLAADHPERVRGLVIVNGSRPRAVGARLPHRRQSDSATIPGATVALDPDAVDQGFDVLRIIAPSVADDDTFRRWWDHAGNRAQSPSEARDILEVIAATDLRETLAHITAPTLILHREDAVMIPVEHGRYLAEHIAGSRYVELAGRRHAALDGRCGGDSRRDRGVRHRCPRGRRRTCAHHNRFHRYRRLDPARGRTRRPAVARSARQPRPHRPLPTPAVLRPGSEHRGRRVRRYLHQSQRGHRLRRGDRRRRPPARHRDPGGHSRRRGRTARRRHRGYGGAHRRARRRTCGTQRGDGVLDRARDRHRVTPVVHRAR